MSYQHIPVLLKEVLDILDPQPNQNFVDATLGGGGYSFALLDAIAPKGRILAIDLDRDAMDNSRRKFAKDIQRVTLAHGNFRDIDHHVKSRDFRDIHGIVADIGLSSYQLDDSGRGISFQKKELLDMRFDVSSKLPDARFILNNWTVSELATIFEEYGEEKFSYKIATNIVNHREKHDELKYTTELTAIIEESLPKPRRHLWKDSARKIFQALRIEVNQELANLEAFLPKAFNILNPGGRLAVVTFHSLEDRIVKNYFKSLVDGCVCPKEFPICKCGFQTLGKLLNKKIITASEAELKMNMRAKSAKLRAIQKLQSL
jgi:16S rRNA (cytosine1402-N4)-methyltransferase